MQRTLEEQHQFEMQCYGCLETELEEMVELQSFGDPRILAMAILSDAQEMMERGNNEIARQFINKAKWVMSKHWPK